MIKSIIAYVGILVALILIVGIFFWPIILGVVLTYCLEISGWWWLLFIIIEISNIYIMKDLLEEKK